MSEKLFHVGVKGLITDEQGKMLLFKADVSTHKLNTSSYWDIPGGRIKKGHAALETLKREIEEETGLKITGRPQFLTAVISNHEIPVSKTQKVGLVLMVYKVNIPNNAKIILSPEHTAYEWVNPKEAAKRLAHKYPKEFTAKVK